MNFKTDAGISARGISSKPPDQNGADMTPNDLPLPVIDAAEQAFAAERWASTRVRLMYAIAAALDALREELARPEPFAWATFDGEQSYDLRLYAENEDYCQDYIKRNGEKYASWVMPLYAVPRPIPFLNLGD